MRQKHFLNELEITVDELWGNHPPRVQLLGWWWKKYIPHFQRQQKVMQEMIDFDWKENNMSDRYRKTMEHYLKNEIKGYSMFNRESL